MTGCAYWEIEAKLPPLKDWAETLLHGKDRINTSWPILFVGNTNDPVTPLRSAVKMSRKFANAGLFEVQIEGHCSISALSICAIKKIREYLLFGKVPDLGRTADGGGWETCAGDERPWKRFGSLRREGLTAAEAEMVEAWRGLQAASEEVTRHLPRGKLLMP